MTDSSYIARSGHRSVPPQYSTVTFDDEMATHRLQQALSLPVPLVMTYAQIREMAEAATKPQRFPVQPPVGSVLRFQRTYSNHHSAKVYDYVALRSEVGWHLTGHQNAVLGWEQLVEKIGDNECMLVTDYVEIPRAPVNPLDEIDNPRDWFDAVFGPDSDAHTGASEDHEVDHEVF